MSIRHHIVDLGSPLNRGVIGWWFVDTDFAMSPTVGGSTWVDATNYRRPLTLTNMDVATDLIVADGRRCLDFDGLNDYAFQSGFSLNGATGATIAIWANITSGQSGRYLLSIPNTSGGGNGFDIYMGGATSLASWLKTATSDTGISATYTYASAGWLRIVATYDGANHKLYVNGGEIATAARNGTITAGAGELNVGRFGSFGAHAGARITDVRVWNRGLSATEVMQDYRRWMDWHQQYSRRRSRRRAGGFKAAWARNSNVILSGAMA